MKTLLFFLSLCLGLQSYSLPWTTRPAISIYCNHWTHLSREELDPLQLRFRDALDEGLESLEISSTLGRGYASEKEALEEVRDAFFSVQSHPRYFMYRPEIRASWQRAYSDEGLGFSYYEVSFQILPQFSDEDEQGKMWKKIVQEVEDMAFKIRSQQKTPAEELEMVQELLSQRASYEKSQDQSKNNLYSCLFEGGTQCTGFSQSVYLLVQCLGYPVRILHGDYEGNYHSWNQVQLEGQWYHLDLTANLDPRDGGYTLQYFLRGDDAMEDHQFKEKTQREDYLRGFEEKGHLISNEEELKKLLAQLFSTPGTYQIALSKEMDLSFLPSYSEELKIDFPYHHLQYQVDSKRLKLIISDHIKKVKE